jgi:Domain of unknown function (DUF4928)
MAKTSVANQLDAFLKGPSGRKFLQKGGLCVALVVTRKAIEQGLPLLPEQMLTPQSGQVAGLGVTQVQAILSDHGITKILAREGGRTSRGSIGLMQEYAAFINKMPNTSKKTLTEIEAWWVARVNDFFASEGPKFAFDPAKSVYANLEDLFRAAKMEEEGKVGTKSLGTFLQHIVGAKLEIVLGEGKVEHHGASVADQVSSRPGDFLCGDTVIHVTTHPSEALLNKCRNNLNASLKPVIITLPDSLALAHGQMAIAELENRVDVLDVLQFLTANVLERSGMDNGKVRPTILAILTRYNELVRETETDPSLLIRLP